MGFYHRFLICLLMAVAASLSVAAPVSLAAGFSAPATPATPAVAADPLGRESPRSMVAGMIGAFAELDYDRAALYFDLPASASSRQQLSAAGQARRFHALLDDSGSLKPFAVLSHAPAGVLDDDLPADQENIGEVTLQGKEIPIILTRGQDGERQVWRVSRDTLAQIAAASRRAPAAQAPQQDELLVAGAPLKDWAVLLGLGVLIFGGLWLVSMVVVNVMRRLVADPAASGSYRFVEAALPPLGLLIAVGVFYNWADQLPVSIVARQTLLRYTGIITAIAVVWFGLRLTDGVAELAIARMRLYQRRQIISVIILVRRAVKILLLTFAVIGILSTFGIDVTTGIAALGIGGIALALGAQKTVENLVGSIALIADRPLQVGDFVRIGDVLGTVEDLGIRSSRIRTLDRTMVTIPNGDLSARQIENFAVRDRFLFNPVIAIAYSTPSVKLKEALKIVRQVLDEHEKMAEGARARLGNITDRAFNIEVFAYIDVADFDVQVIIREHLLLAIYEQLEAAGIALAFPTQTILQAPATPQGQAIAQASTTLETP